MMKLFSSKALTAAATALVLSGQAIGFASSASAYDRHGGYGGGYERRFDGPRDYGRRDFDRRNYGYGNGVERGDRGRFDHGPRYVERRKKDHTGRNIAIGIGAVMLGAILASEAARR